MITEAEQFAIVKWYESKMAEAAGPGEGDSDFKGHTNHTYPARTARATMETHLPTELVERWGLQVMLTGSVFDALPNLDETDIGTIMQAGADRFFPQEDHDRR